MMEDLGVDDDNIPEKVDAVRKEVRKIVSWKEYKEAKRMFENCGIGSRALLQF